MTIFLPGWKHYVHLKMRFLNTLLLYSAVVVRGENNRLLFLCCSVFYKVGLLSVAIAMHRWTIMRVQPPFSCWLFFVFSKELQFATPTSITWKPQQAVGIKHAFMEDLCMKIKCVHSHNFTLFCTFSIACEKCSFNIFATLTKKEQFKKICDAVVRKVALKLFNLF